jgi:hypothetical protein
LTIKIFSPLFTDVIIKGSIALGTENHRKFHDELGGISRLLAGNYPNLKNNLIDLVSIGQKRSLIILGGDKKTTITEQTLPSVMTTKQHKLGGVNLFSYAEDINWRESDFGTGSAAIGLVDFSGRYEETSELMRVAESCCKSFAKTYWFLSDHDVFDLKIYSAISSKHNIEIIFHTPKEIRHFSGGDCVVLDNKFYSPRNSDLIGYGDYLAVLVCQQLNAGYFLNREFFVNCQKMIRSHIDGR